MCARVLQVANSPYYGQAGSVASIKRALLLLGVNAVRGIAAAACIRQFIPQRAGPFPICRHHDTQPGNGGRLRQARQPHASAVAPEAFIAGLIHNLGTLIQAALDPTGTAALIAARSADPGAGPPDGRASVLPGGTRIVRGRAVRCMESAGITDFSAQHHHNPVHAPDSHKVLAGLIWAGSHLALCCQFTYSLEPATPARDDYRLRELGFLPEQLDVVSAELRQRVELLSRSLLG